jgi:SHS family lactate transporter-like MFS transporter
VVPHWGWRGLFIVAALPALLVLPIRAWVPESPDWKKHATTAKPLPLRELFSPALLRTLAWASLVMAGGFGIYYGITSLYPTLLQNELGRDAGEKATLVSLFNIGMMVGAVVCGTVASRRGPTLAIAVPALVMVPLLPLYLGAWPDLLWLGALLGGAFGAGFCGVTPLLLTSIFPARVRARCVGLVYHAGAFVAAFVPPGITALSDYAGLSLAMSIGVTAGGWVIVTVASLFIRPRAVPDPETEAGAPPAAVAGLH